jgi:S-adenosylmethionine:tRNA ribosyltransferase-isomerase
MKLSAFKFELPQELIAQYPPKNRDDSRMIVVDRKNNTIEHRKFTDITDYFGQGDTLVVNDTKVFPARLHGHKEKTNAVIEVFLLRELNKDAHLWDVLVDPARKIRVGNKLFFGNGDMVAEVIDNTTSRGRTIRFLYDGTSEEFHKLLHVLGEMPIPKELGRRAEAIDIERYQTIFAEHRGAVSAPTGGLHFTPQVVKRIKLKGASVVPITMHVGLGTFREVDVEDLSKHKTDSEQFWVTEKTANTINDSINAKKRVCAVGTSSLRALESSVSAGGFVKPNEGWTDKFIVPPYDFRICNSLLTNLHRPQSILLMMTCAFGGFDLIMRAYEEAVKEKYRFFTYGDAMLII